MTQANMEKEIKPTSNWELASKIEKIVDRNCKEVPYEGTEVTKTDMRIQLLEMLEQDYIITKK